MTRIANAVRFCSLIIAFSQFAHAENPTNVTLVEAQADSVCSADCPPIPLPKIYGAYLYCLKAGNEVLIGEHQMWEIGLSKLARLEGQSLPSHWDQRHIWVTLPNGWTVRLNQYNYEYSFRDERCRNAAQLRSFQHGYTRPGPVPGEPTQPVMRGNLVYGWTLCSRSLDVRLLPITGQFKCKVWDLEGRVRQDAAFRLREGSAEAQWNDGIDGEFCRLRLKDGKTLEKLDSGS